MKTLKDEELKTPKSINKQQLKNNVKVMLKTLKPHIFSNRKFNTVTKGSDAENDKSYSNGYENYSKINLTGDSIQRIKVTKQRPVTNSGFRKKKLFTAKFINKPLKSHFNKISRISTTNSKDYDDEDSEVDEEDNSSDNITAKKLGIFPSYGIFKRHGKLSGNLQHYLKFDNVTSTVSPVISRSNLNYIQEGNANNSNSVFNFHFNNSIKFTSTVNTNVDTHREKINLENALVSLDTRFKGNDMSQGRYPLWNWKWIWNWNSDLEPVTVTEFISNPSTDTFPTIIDNTEETFGTTECSKYVSSITTNEELTLNVTEAPIVTESITPPIITLQSSKMNPSTYTKCLDYSRFDYNTSFIMFNSVDIIFTQLLLTTQATLGDQEPIWYDPAFLRTIERPTHLKTENGLHKFNSSNTFVNTTVPLLLTFEDNREKRLNESVLLTTPKINPLPSGINNSNKIHKRKASKLMKFRHVCRKGMLNRKHLH